MISNLIGIGTDLRLDRRCRQLSNGFLLCGGLRAPRRHLADRGGASTAAECLGFLHPRDRHDLAPLPGLALLECSEFFR